MVWKVWIDCHLKLSLVREFSFPHFLREDSEVDFSRKASFGRLEGGGFEGFKKSEKIDC